MDTSNNTHDRIEPRSEKVRKLIGEIPPSLVRWGTVIIAVVFIALLVAVCMLPYPYSNGESILKTLHWIKQPLTQKCINSLEFKEIPFCVIDNLNKLINFASSKKSI